MRRITPIFSLVISVITISCSNAGVSGKGAVKLVKPEVIESLTCESFEGQTFSEILNAIDVWVCDTILVVQGIPENLDSCHFRAFSTFSLKSLGPFIHAGRGPGEMVSPHIVGVNPASGSMTLLENESGGLLTIDIVQSIKESGMAVLEEKTLPADLIDYLPVSGSNHVESRLKDHKLLFYAVDNKGEDLKPISLFDNVDAEQNITFLSSIMAPNPKSGQVAVAMLMLPQIFIFNAETGDIKSVAINKEFCNWEAVFSQGFNMDTRQYYSGITSTPEYIITSYSGATLGDIMQGRGTSSIHIYDWEGRFLYKFDVNENIGQIAYDRLSGFLYCIDRSTGSIVKYDIKQL